MEIDRLGMENNFLIIIIIDDLNVIKGRIEFCTSPKFDRSIEMILIVVDVSCLVDQSINRVEGGNTKKKKKYPCAARVRAPN